MPGFMAKLWLCHPMAVWLWAGPLASLELSLLGCKVGNRHTYPVAGGEDREGVWRWSASFLAHGNGCTHGCLAVHHPRQTKGELP